MSNKFNQFGASGFLDPTDGSLDIWGKTIKGSNLGFNQAVITDGFGILQTTPLGGGVAGNDTELQFNDGGVFGADALLTFQNITKLFTVNGVSIDINGQFNKGGNLWLHDTGTDNFAGGNNALGSLTTGSGSTAFGDRALDAVVTANRNSAFGRESGFLTTGNDHAFFGYGSGRNITTTNNTIMIQNDGVVGDANICRIGNATHTGGTFITNKFFAGTTQSIAVGEDAGGNDAVGNSMFGNRAGINITTGAINSGFGNSALANLTIGGNNQAYGSNALNNLVSGNFNMAFGFDAGTSLTTNDSDNILISNAGVAGDNTTIRIGTTGTHTDAFIAGIHGVTPGGVTQTVVIDANGELGSTATVGGAALPTGYITGMINEWQNANEVDILAGSCRDIDDTMDLIFVGTLNVDIGVVGATGLQTGSTEAASTWYSINIIGDTSAVNNTTALMIPEGVAFSQTGYDAIRRVGWVYNNSASALRPWSPQVGNSRTRTYYWDADRELVLFAGGATVRTGVDLSDWVPPTSREVVLYVSHDAGGTGDNVELFPSDAVNTDAPFRVQSSGGDFGSNMLKMPCGPTQVVDYANSGAGDDTYIAPAGYVDQI